MGVFATSVSHALGRIPQGSRLRLTVPWPVGSIDPHALDDGAAALFGSAIADPLYAIGPSGHPYPALADALPERAGSGVTVRLRPGMTTGAGRPLSGEDVVFSLRRSGARAAVALLGSFGRPELSRGDRMEVFIPGATPKAAAQALSSPLTAIVPKGFVAHRPDGTGAFRVRQHRFGITLERNERAARGPAFVQSIEVSTAASLAEALRAFETGDADVGWLGAGLHNPRPGASMFNAGRLGWVVLRTGNEALEWGAPGVAQTLADAVRPEQLQPYGLVPLPESGVPAVWGGLPSEVVVRRDAAQLAEIARIVAGVLGNPGRELRVMPLAARQFAHRRRTGKYALMVDFVRPVGFDPDALALSLMTAQDPALARRPPLGGLPHARHVTRTLRLGVLGRLDHIGASLKRFRGLPAWTLGSVWDEALLDARG